jgi:hypothetical protein
MQQRHPTINHLSRTVGASPLARPIIHPVPSGGSVAPGAINHSAKILDPYRIPQRIVPHPLNDNRPQPTPVRPLHHRCLQQTVRGLDPIGPRAVLLQPHPIPAPSHPVGASPSARPAPQPDLTPRNHHPRHPSGDQRHLGLPIPSARGRASYNPIRPRTTSPRRSVTPGATNHQPDLTPRNHHPRHPGDDQRHLGHPIPSARGRASYNPIRPRTTSPRRSVAPDATNHQPDLTPRNHHPRGNQRRLGLPIPSARGRASYDPIRPPPAALSIGISPWKA